MVVGSVYRPIDSCRSDVKIRHNINDMILMIQREVAERIVAKPKSKEYGILSVFSQLYSKPKILFHISRNVFTPKPAVDSAMVQWDFSAEKKYVIRDEILFDEIVHLTFQQRRKMLRNSLQQLPEFSLKLEQIDFDLTKRPEELTIDEVLGDLPERKLCIRPCVKVSLTFQQFDNVLQPVQNQLVNQREITFAVLFLYRNVASELKLPEHLLKLIITHLQSLIVSPAIFFSNPLDCDIYKALPNQ